ncbi:TPA: restriction endonuclease [Clostridium perfringens]
MSYHIEVCVSKDIQNTEKGRILERLGKDVLESMQYYVKEEIRLTGIEVDLLAINKISGEEIYVECKAHKNPLSADVITKILGNLTIKGVSSGWLLTTGPLGKDAKGIQHEWEKRPSEIRKQLNIYTNDRIIDLLISTGKICDTSFLKDIKNKNISNDQTLIISNYGMFWVIPIIEANAGIPCSVMVFDTNTGEQIVDENIINRVSSLDTTFKELNWIKSNDIEDGKSLKVDLLEECRSILTVSSGDKWTDYRPSRPQDFVGRDKVLKELFDFFYDVINVDSTTRLFSISSPSGWGKSSVVVKAIDTSMNKKNRDKVFIYGVDVRTAMSSRYPELVLKTCLEEAVKSKFIDIDIDNIQVPNITEPFSDPKLKNILTYLRDNKKVIAIVFDQFEEIFSKRELSSLFDNIKKLSFYIDSIKENIILGFAWKTDLSIPVDHSAYHMWHSLSDRRKEFELTQFNEKDISKALKIFSKELGATISPIVKRYLTDQCQGYPWLLKKLSIHVYNLIEDGADQNEIIGQGLNIESLFEKDLMGLTPDEERCIYEIAKESPADYFKISDMFGSDLVKMLLDKRLVLRKASKLILYWDIFKDYVLDKKVPEIYVNYIPQMTYNSFNKIIQVLIDSSESSVDSLVSSLAYSKRTMENSIIDLAMFGLIEKENDRIKLMRKNLQENQNMVRDFFKNHITVKKLRSTNKTVSIQEFKDIFNSIYDYNEKTASIYINKLLRWLECLMIISINGNKVNIINEDDFELDMLRGSAKSSRKGNGNKKALFLGQATPKSIEEVVEIINNDKLKKENIIGLGYRNTLSILNAINIIELDDDGYIYIDKSLDEIIKRIKETNTYNIVKEYIDHNLDCTNLHIGEYLSNKINKKWSEESKKRYGGGIRVWIKYTEENYTSK